MVLLQRPEEALELLHQAKAKSVQVSEAMVRVEIDAMCDLSRWKELTDRFQDTIETLSDESLLRFGHASAAQAKPELLQLARDEAARRTETEAAPRIANMLQHLHWEMLLDAGDSATVRHELEQAGVTPQCTSVIELYFATRAYSEDEALRSRFVDRVAELAPVSDEPQALAMGSRAMLRAHRYADVIVLLEKLLPEDAFTPLHVDLLHSYVLTGHYAKARDLLLSMSSAWRSSPEARGQALSLYNNVGDWARMREVLERSISDAPTDASAWLTLIRVCACEGAMNLDALMADVPSELVGPAKDLLLLASIEMRHGQLEKGLNRVARTMRSTHGDVEVAATHVQAMLLVSESMDMVYHSPGLVAPGTSVELSDELGNLHHISIDFDDAPSQSGPAEFISPSSSFASNLLGLSVGETVSVSNLVGVQVFQVKQIRSLHLRLLELSHKVVAESVVPSKNLVSMTIPQDASGEMDFSFFQRQLDQRTAEIADLLKLYEQPPLTLGLIAKQLGRDIIELVCGWPSDGPYLEVSLGGGVAHDVPPCSLEESSWVVDLTMLTELAILGLLDVLGELPRVYVSTATRRALDMKIESSTSFRRRGTMFSHEGQLGFHEETEESHAKEQAFLNSISIAISSYCTVVPAYGPLRPTPVLQRLGDILDVEEHASLTLCEEYKAGLISVDARLRNLAKELDIISVSCQMLLKHMTDNGVIRSVEYSCALIKMLNGHRSFISLRITDLVAMMDQGLSFANIGVNSLRAYLAAPSVEFNSAMVTITGFISHMFETGRCTFGMLLELIRHLIEPLFRHPHCPNNFIDSSFQAFTVLQSCGLTDMHFEYIKRQLADVKESAKRPEHRVTMNAEVMCLRDSLLYSYGSLPSFMSSTTPQHLTSRTSRDDAIATDETNAKTANIIRNQATTNVSDQQAP